MMYITVVRSIITYAATNELSKTQRLVCLGITAAMIVTSSYSPLLWVIIWEARMGHLSLLELPSGRYWDRIDRKFDVEIML